MLREVVEMTLTSPVPKLTPSATMTLPLAAARTSVPPDQRLARRRRVAESDGRVVAVDGERPGGHAGRERREIVDGAGEGLDPAAVGVLQGAAGGADVEGMAEGGVRGADDEVEEAAVEDDVIGGAAEAEFVGGGDRAAVDGDGAGDRVAGVAQVDGAAGAVGGAESEDGEASRGDDVVEVDVGVGPDDAFGGRAVAELDVDGADGGRR